MKGASDVITSHAKAAEEVMAKFDKKKIIPRDEVPGPAEAGLFFPVCRAPR